MFAYFIIRYTDINRLASGSFHQVLTIPRDFYATTFLSDRGCGHLGSRPVNTFLRAIISRNRVWLRAGALHLPKSKTTFLEWPQAVVVTTDFVSGKGTVTFLFFVSRLTGKKEISLLRIKKSTNPTVAIRILHRFIRALSSSFVPFLKLSDWL